MIGRLKGTLIEKNPPELLIDVAGVGYEVQVSMHSVYQLPEPGAEITLLIQSIYREDAQLLFGFVDTNERALFRSLVKTNGIGPKLALSILSSFEPKKFIACIHDQDSASLVKIPGVGKKMAERLIVEMKDKLAGFDGDVPSSAIMGGHSTASATNDAISALITLGYNPKSAGQVVNQLSKEYQSSEELIKFALAQMSKA